MKYVILVALCIVQLTLASKPAPGKIPKEFVQHMKAMEQKKPAPVKKLFDMGNFGYHSENREYNMKLGTMIHSASQALHDLCGQFIIHHKNPCHLRNSAECQCHRAGYKIQLPKMHEQRKTMDAGKKVKMNH